MLVNSHHFFSFIATASVLYEYICLCKFDLRDVTELRHKQRDGKKRKHGSAHIVVAILSSFHVETENQMVDLIVMTAAAADFGESQ